MESSQINYKRLAIHFRYPSISNNQNASICPIEQLQGDKTNANYNLANINNYIMTIDSHYIRPGVLN